jgi:hypothetical protein
MIYNSERKASEDFKQGVFSFMHRSISKLPTCKCGYRIDNKEICYEDIHFAFQEAHRIYTYMLREDMKYTDNVGTIIELYEAGI